MKIEIGQTIFSKFATLNKNETLGEYKELCDLPKQGEYTNWNIEKCLVEQYFKLTASEFREISENLFEHRLIFREKGGNQYTGKNQEVIDAGDDFWKTPKLLEEYKKDNARLVTILENEDTKELMAIDPQGHNNARYVGINIH